MILYFAMEKAIPFRQYILCMLHDEFEISSNLARFSCYLLEVIVITFIFLYWMALQSS